MSRHRVAVVTSDVLSARMAGPAIRAWQMARGIAREHDVELLSTRRCDLSSTSFRCAHSPREDMQRLGDRVDVVVLQGDVLRYAPALVRSPVAMVVDLYDPFHLEVLEQTRGFNPLDRRAAVSTATDVINEQVRRGDLFLCASDRQRDFWLGQLAAIGRVNEHTYDQSPNLQALLRVVPFGVEDEPPRHLAPALRGVVDGISADDEIVLWGGGIYNWFDPLSLIHAVDRLRHRRPKLRLFFAGVRHPNPEVPEMEMNARAQALAEALGLTGSHVFFHEWIDYDARQSYLLEADVAVSTHFDHIETAFSFRTRVLDYLWAGLPTVTTEGDVLADAIAERGAGITVPAENVDALEAALERILGDRFARDAMGASARELGAYYRWSTVLQPLLDFCAQPARSPDLLDGDTAKAIARSRTLRPNQFVESARRAADLGRRGEWSELGAKVAGRIRRARS